ncbi:MAG: hypothetical protein JJ954_11835 [Hyphomonas sp.]|uniref:hypothetical protein n=1 Tax=unclassified Hyphomonas TaxID=2630699 RepID=UPI001A8F0598|nr:MULTISPECIES: hypothetical protein [unclassified Hyphomonas]MBO6583635.1 hypothetical protein [Hyphomonas sp.]QSR22615.1 hypothetical protein CFA77_09945 [Hyphomonas sp. KY3]
MTRKTLDHLGYPRSTAKEVGEIQHAAERRREQMLPGNGPFEPIQEEPVSHFKGEDDSVELGPEPEIGPVVTENTLVDEESRDS